MSCPFCQAKIYGVPTLEDLPRLWWETTLRTWLAWHYWLHGSLIPGLRDLGVKEKENGKGKH